MRQTSEAYELEVPQYQPNEDPAASSQKLEPDLDLQDLNWVEYDMRHEQDLEPAYEPEHEQPLASRTDRIRGARHRCVIRSATRHRKGSTDDAPARSPTAAWRGSSWR